MMWLSPCAHIEPEKRTLETSLLTPIKDRRFAFLWSAIAGSSQEGKKNNDDDDHHHFSEIK